MMKTLQVRRGEEYGMTNTLISEMKPLRIHFHEVERTYEKYALFSLY